MNPPRLRLALTFLLLVLMAQLLLPSPTHALPSPPIRRLPSEQSCLVTCFVPDPVCGEDGNTYWCGAADAACNGIGVAKEGFCAVGNGRNGGGGLFPGQAFLLVHITWLIVLGFSVVFGLF